MRALYFTVPAVLSLERDIVVYVLYSRDTETGEPLLATEFNEIGRGDLSRRQLDGVVCQNSAEGGSELG